MATNAATFGLAWQYHQAGNLQQAEQLYRQVIQADPSHSDAWCFLGAACQAQGRLAEAEVSFRRAVQLLPDHPSAPNCLGIVLALQGRLDDSARVFEPLVARQPDNPEALNNLGLVRYKQDRLDEALPLYRRALEIRPDFGDAHNNLGNIFADQLKLKEALAEFDLALRYKPDFPECRFNRATLLLLHGNLTEGWQEYESRWRQPGFVLPPYRQPRWDGSPLAGKTILLWAEQGMGDTIQFIRYVPLVKQHGGRVVVACQPLLMRLLESLPGVDQVVSKDGPPPSFDAYTPLLSVPRILNTSMATIPRAVPFVHADAQLVEHWRRELAPLQGLKVGIAWQGSPTYRFDRKRSMPLAHFARLAQVPGVNLISLQKGPGTEQLRAAAGQFPVLDFGDRLDTTSGPFMDSAAIIKNLDLVITSDTAIPHLAGALGARVWVALGMVPDWRWLLQREDSPWYPTMRLFRQTRQGSWDDVFDRMAGELRALQLASDKPEKTA